MTTTDQVLEERGSVYGDFYEGIELEANLLESLKHRHQKHHGEAMHPIYATYISKIIMKLSRLAVSPDHIDSWTDIAGYARLVELHLKETNNA
jgi:Domain of unknown function (DUF6378)